MNISDQIDHNREIIVERALQQYRLGGNTRRSDVQFRGQNLPLEVVRLPPAVLLLNHSNNRLQAQLIDHPKHEIVRSAPTSSASQELIADLLRKTEKFTQLRDDLKDNGQVNPGLITRQGVLINGNTRAVALRDLNVDGIDVAVLPGDALDLDYLDIEMQLQMQKLTHQDYTFTNGLLLIATYLRADKSVEQLGKRMNWGKGSYKKKCTESTQLLALVEEVRNLTSVPISYTNIDPHRQHMIDLNTDYQFLLRSRPAEAEKLKWGRIIAMFLDVNKDQTRAIKSDFFESLVIDRLEAESDCLKYVDTFRSQSIDDGLSSLLGSDESTTNQIALKPLAKDIVGKLQTNTGELLHDFPNELNQLRSAIRISADSSINESKMTKLDLAAERRVRESRIVLENVLSELPRLVVNKDFKLKEFAFELKKLDAVIRGIESCMCSFADSKQ